MTTVPTSATPRPDKTALHFDENAQHIAKRQYLQQGDGDISGMFWRIADWVAGAEKPEARQKWAQQYYDLMAEKKFCPGGRVLAGAGTQHGNVLNCFVQGATEHAPESFEGVMEVAKKLALVTKVGGGNGVNLDVYTPRAASSRSDSGVRGWVYMSATHPDVQDFIEGLMRPPTQPDGEKQPVAVRNWTRVVYGQAISPELVANARSNGVSVVRTLPEGVHTVPDDMGGIVDAARMVAENAKLGLEPRIDLSQMREEGAPIKGSGGTSSGPVSFLLEIFDNFLEWANRGAEQSGPINTLRYVYAPVLRVVRQGGCLHPDTLVHTDRGTLRLRELVDVNAFGHYPHALSVATDEGWKHSPEGFNNGHADTLKVTLDSGLSVQGTPNHKLKVLRENGVREWVRLDELKVGDWAIQSLDGHTGSPVLLEPLPAQHFNAKEIRTPDTLTEDLAFWLGYLWGDGFVSGQRIGFAVTHGSPMQEEGRRLFRDLFGLELREEQKENDRSTVLVTRSAALVNWLELNGLLKGKALTLEVPRAVRQAPRPVLGAFLRGLFEADGTLLHGYPQLSAASEAFAHDVAVLLGGLGIPTKLSRYGALENRYSEREHYRLHVVSSKGLERYRERVGWLSGSRFEALATFRPDEARESSWPLPHAAALLAGVHEGLPAGRKGAPSEFTGTRKTLSRYIRGERSLTAMGYAALGTNTQVAEALPAFDYDEFYSQVREVTPAGRSLTLDICVDENHTYVAGGLVTHNTRRGAGMATISIAHPDILDFLTAKDLDREAAEGDISTFNISILVDTRFWDTLQAGGLWPLEAQDVAGKYYLAPQTGEYSGTLPQLPTREEDGAKGVPVYAGGIPAAWLWDEIAQHAWSTGEPGLIFNDRVNEYSALKNLGKRYEIRSTNPCVTADTWVSTAFGARQVRDLIGKDFCATVDGQSFEARGGFWLTGVKPVLKVTTRRGYELRLTDNHRLLKVTRQTRDVQETAWTETGDLAAGDCIMLNDHRSVKAWAGAGNFSEGWLLGSLIGDGTFITDKARPMAALGFWGEQREELADAAQTMLRRLGAVKKLWRSNDEERGRIRLSSEALAELAAKYDIRHGKKTLTDQVEQAGYEFYRGVLQGLFDADGSVQGHQSKGVSVRLAQSDLGLLQRAQRMLARLGILSSLYPGRRAAGTHSLPDGKGGSAEYSIKAQHELVISGSNLSRFAEVVGFRDSRKNALLSEKLAGYARELNRERFCDEIVSIVPDGEEAVYDVTVEQVHAFDANGVLAHNCGEIPLTVGEPCDLGAINLAAYVENSTFNFKLFRQDVRTCVRFLDDVLDVNVFALEDNRVASQDLRRLGLGVMGLADALIKMGLRYDNEAGRQAIYDIMSALREEAVAESERLGAERGIYPVYERHADKIPHQPRRNVAVLTVAPTGTTSMLMGVSSGIEPVFSPFIWRKIGSEYRALLAPLFVELLESYPAPQGMSKDGKWDWDKVTEAVSENHGSVVGLSFIPEAIQQVFVCAHDISPADHVRMQGTVQRAFDDGGQHAANSLSKTINLPNSATVQDVQDAYSEAYKTGCKGITVYRDGSRQFQVLSTSKKKAKKEEAETEKAEAIPQPSTLNPQPSTPQPSTPQPRYERPARLRGVTDMVKLTDPTSGHRRSFLVTVNELEGKPVEVMVISGRAGDEANADSEALGRVVSIALQHGVPAQAIIHTLRGINGGLYGSYNGRLVGSKADLIAVALDTFQKELGQKDLEASTLPPLAGGSGEPAPSSASQGVSTDSMQKEKCPVCEAKAVIREEGCLKCQACGYSKCG
ncbi:LAGLIDADG family homing endonuclease [Deinococcus sp. VB343]|uniref:Ribonucleoside-diphosphate reductase n=1 Tax=Deinococcus sp. VB142 TaxID=3112952 RepID=A0AAU6Q6A4_9DEIO